MNSTKVVSSVIEAIRDGGLVVITDPEQCMLAIAGEAVQAADVNRLVHEGGGIVSVAMKADRVDQIGLQPLGGYRDGRATVSVDSGRSTTGISASERAETIRTLCGRDVQGLVVPGHVFPLRIEDSEVNRCVDIPAAGVWLAEAAGVVPVVAICQILDESGELLRPEELGQLSALAALPQVSIHAILAHARGFTTIERCAVDEFRDVMSGLIAGVAAITVRANRDEPKGLLATAVTSYSDQPPSLLVCIGHASRAHDALMAAPGFGVHLLASGQGGVASALSGRGENKFATVDWAWDGDVPRISETAVYLRCLRAAAFRHADHSILIGEIEVAETSEASPLIYFRRSFDWSIDAAA